MSYQYSSQKKATDVGQQAKYDELNETLLYSSPHQEHGPAHPGVDGRPGAPAAEPATDADGQELRASRSREYAAETDATYTVGGSGDGEYADVDAIEAGQALGDRLDEGEAGALVGEAAAGAYWQEALLAGRDEELNGLGDPFVGTAGRESFSLATEERIAGEHAERERQREKAHGAVAAGIDRARQCRKDVTAQAADQRATSDEIPSDPRPGFSQDVLAAVNQQARSLSKRLTSGPTPAALSRRLARRVQDGTDVVSAALHLLEDLYEESGVVAPISKVDPWQYEADIQGTVTKLFEPAAPSQQQVGYITDESGASVKVTIWEKSQQGTVLHEGDEVRIRAGKPDQYNGQLTLAVTHDTIVEVVERGKGPAPVHHTCRADIWENASDFQGEQRHRPCTQPNTGSKAVVRPKAARFKGAESWMFPASACPNWWCEREEVHQVDTEADGGMVASASD